MAFSTTASAEDLARNRGRSDRFAENIRSQGSAVSWGAIAAGAAAAASLSLILLILGVGLGLSSVSPWIREGISASTFGVSTILWLTLTQLLASALGGYLAGRLRTKWTDVHSDEVYFRDTAHGFLAWAMASLATAALLGSAIGSILGTGVQAGTAVVGGVPSTASSVAGSVVSSARMAQGSDGGPMAYFVDSLFRRDAYAVALTAGTTGATESTASTGSPTGSLPGGAARDRASDRDTAEVSRIFMNVSRSEPLPSEDIRYVGQIVAQRTGISQRNAEKRVADVYAKAQAEAQDAEATARDIANKTRKASAYSALWLFVSLLVGAFVASLSATFGGRRRDA
jgi:hypothetical protein